MEVRVGETYRHREIETHTQSLHLLVHSQDGAGWNKNPGAPSRSLSEAPGFQSLKSSSVAFPRMLTGSWIRYAAAGLRLPSGCGADAVSGRFTH